MPKPSKFWRALETVPGTAAVPVVWKEYLGAEFTGASRFLRPTLHHAEAYPCPSPGGDGCPRRVVRHPRGEIIAVCGDAPKRCESIRLTPQDATLLEVDLNVLAKEVVSGLGVSWQTLAMTPVSGVWRIGAYKASFDRHLPVYLLIRHSAEEVRQSAQELSVSTDASSVLLLPTRTWADEARQALIRSKGVLIALDEMLSVADDGSLSRLGDMKEAVGALGHDEGPGQVGHYVFRKEGEKWVLAYGGESFFLNDAVGLSYIAHLLAFPDKEFGVVELDQACGAGSADSRPGSAGEMIDTQALGDYRRKMKELEEELEEADKNNDQGRRNAIKDEIDAINRELSRGVGRGGRQRRALDDAERLRKRVSMGIKRALERIKEQNHDMWVHLDNAIRQGRSLVYHPDRQIHWDT